MGHCDKCNVDFDDADENAANAHKHEEAAAEGGDAPAENAEAPAEGGSEEPKAE
tara:strand:+ start:10761 stop:10922 length:162 start_codon:yes stop_codon:yes gene_type:complete